MNKRDDTRREVLLDVRDEPIMSIDALVEQCHRALSAQLWMTCCWSERCSTWSSSTDRQLATIDEARLAVVIIPRN